MEDKNKTTDSLFKAVPKELMTKDIAAAATKLNPAQIGRMSAEGVFERCGTLKNVTTIETIPKISHRNLGRTAASGAEKVGQEPNTQQEEGIKKKNLGDMIKYIKNADADIARTAAKTTAEIPGDGPGGRD